MKAPVWQYWAIISAAAVTIMLFQNCADDFNSELYLSSTSGDEFIHGAQPDIKAPGILQGLKDSTVIAGQDMVFQVTADGSNPTYQWFKDGTVLSGMDSNVLIISGVTAADHAGTYTVRISNTLGSAESSATLTVQNPPPTSPLSVALSPGVAIGYAGRDTIIMVAIPAGGNPPYSYTWYHKSIGQTAEKLITGANSNRLVYSPIQLIHAGNYRVVVNDNDGNSAQKSTSITVERLSPDGVPY